jgi:ferredoxin
MRIVLDLNRCQGYAQCVPLAPEVLKMHGEEALAYDPNPDDSQRQRVLRAVASCPVQAILVHDWSWIRRHTVRARSSAAPPTF